MITTIRFYKEDNHRWFADIPEWKGDKEDLEMTLNADTMLDIICEGDDYVFLTLSTEPIDGFDVLDLEVKCSDYDFFSQGGTTNGAYYIMKSYRGIEFNLKIWLCDVTKFVFGDFPQKIYVFKNMVIITDES